MAIKKIIFMVLLSSFVMINSASALISISVKVNDNYITSDAAPFITNSCTYVPIRFIAEALDTDKIVWDSVSQSVTIQNNSKTILLFVNKNYAYINNKYTQLANNALLVNSRTFVPIRFIAECFDADVDWDQDSYTVSINIPNNTSNTVTVSQSNSSNTSSGSYSKPYSTVLTTTQSNSVSNNKSTSENENTITENKNSTASLTVSDNNTSIIYDYEDAVYWLSRIIEAEAVGEPFIGKVAVGEVILNRVKSNEFPNTIWGVIFDDNFGIQFEPVSNGTIYNTPSEESILAAKTAIEGSNYVKNCLYFLNPAIAKSTWISKNREYYTTISHHEFYV